MLSRIFGVLLWSILWTLLSVPMAFSKEKLVVAVSIPVATHGWTRGVIHHAREAVDNLRIQYPQVEFYLDEAANGIEQTRHLAKLLEKRLDALVVLPHKPALLLPHLRKAQSDGVYVVVVDRIVTKLPRDVYVAGDNSAFGRLSGEYLAQRLQGRGRIVVLEGLFCDVNTQGVEAFRSAIAPFPGLRILDSQPADWDQNKGLEIMDAYLNEFSEIDAVWCGDDDVLEGVAQAIAESGRKDIKIVMGGGGSKTALKRILLKDPLVTATVTYPPEMIATGIELAVKRLIYGTAYPAQVIVPSELVTKENVRTFYFHDASY